MTDITASLKAIADSIRKVSKDLAAIAKTTPAGSKPQLTKTRTKSKKPAVKVAKKSAPIADATEQQAPVA